MANPVIPGGVGSPQAIYETSTTQHHRIGERGMLSDRSFRYARSIDASGIVLGSLLQSAAPEAAHVSETGTLTGFTAGRQDFTAVLGAAAAAANRYESGFIKIQSSTLGAGQIYRLVGGHGAVASAGTISLRTEHPIVTTPTGTVTWSLTPNRWADVIIQPTTITSTSAGVNLVAIPAASATAPVFCWVQTWGSTSVLIDTSAIVAGSSVIVGANAGTVGVAVETDIKQRIGVAEEAITTDSIFCNVFLMIAP
jgi:hypothetical protein